LFVVACMTKPPFDSLGLYINLVGSKTGLEADKKEQKRIFVICLLYV
jgi:hypothetical protein